MFLLELATGKVTQVTHESHAGQPAWAPDGKAILYLRFLPREEDLRPASIFGRPALGDLRKIALGGDGKPCLLRICRAPVDQKSDCGNRSQVISF